MHRLPFSFDPDKDVEWTAVRAQGAGGQNVNKVSSAVHLRFDIRASSLSESVKERLLAWPDQRITRDGVIVIKAQTSRSQQMNRQEALQRLQDLVNAAAVPRRVRRPTQPTKASQQRRLEMKSLHAKLKATRSKSAAD